MTHRHCHFTYRNGEYVSPWFWPTREDAEHASHTFVPDLQYPSQSEIYQVHGADCVCTPIEEGTLT